MDIEKFTASETDAVPELRTINEPGHEADLEVWITALAETLVQHEGGR